MSTERFKSEGGENDPDLGVGGVDGLGGGTPHTPTPNVGRGEVQVVSSQVSMTYPFQRKHTS